LIFSEPLDEGGSNVLVKELIVRVEDRDDIVLDLAGIWLVYRKLWC